MSKDLIDFLRKQGHEIKLDGERLLFTPAPGTPFAEKQVALKRLKEAKQEVIAYLVSLERKSIEEIRGACGVVGCHGCYETELGRIHPPASDAR